MALRFVPSEHTPGNSTGQPAAIKATDIFGDSAIGESLKALADSGALNFLLEYVSYVATIFVSTLSQPYAQGPKLISP